MDSLLDALTNVVGMMLLILIITSLGISNAVRVVVENLPEVSKEEMEALKVSVEKTRTNLQKLIQTKTEMQEKQATPEDAAQLAVELEEFQKDNKDLADKTSDIEEWRKRVEEEEKKKAVNEEEVKTAATALADLKAILARTPKRAEKDAKIVRMPNPRLAPDESQAYYVVCRNNKVYFAGNPYEHAFKLRDVIDANIEKLAFTGKSVGSYTFSLVQPRMKDDRYPSIEERVSNTRSLEKQYEAWNQYKYVGMKKEGTGNAVTYTAAEEKGMFETIQQWCFHGESSAELSIAKLRLDPAKVKEFFGDGKLGPRDFKYFVEPSGDTDRLTFSLGFKDEGGWTVDEFRRNDSEFDLAIRKVQSNRGSLIYFYVAPDSFDAYLQAREMTESYNIPAGWTTWKGDKLGSEQLKPMTRLETVEVAVDTVPAEFFRKLADSVGPYLIAEYKKEIDGFQASIDSVKIPDDLPEADKADFKQRLRDEKAEWLMRYYPQFIREVFQGAIVAADVRGIRDVRLSIQPPEIPQVRLFKPSNPPSQPKPKEDPNAKKEKPKPATPPSKTIILD